MATSMEKSRALAGKYIGKKVEAKLDGGLFDHVAATFRFRFVDPQELQDAIREDYEDYLEDWDFSELVPVAAVSSAEATDYEFAWIFLDWRDERETPGVVVTTTDDWGQERTVDSLGELGLKIL